MNPSGPNPYGKPFLSQHPEMNVISNIEEAGVRIGNRGDGEAIRYVDMIQIDKE